MKILLLGGANQGKTDYAIRTFALSPTDIADGGTAPFAEVLAAPALANLHLLVRRMMEAGQNPREAIPAALGGRESWIVISDEIGSGVVPIDKTDRDWREETGRTLCELAARADRVERVVAGLPLRLKG